VAGRQKTRKSRRDSRFHYKLTASVNFAESELMADAEAHQKGGVPLGSSGMQKAHMAGKCKLAARKKMNSGKSNMGQVPIKGIGIFNSTDNLARKH
jgi:hypothetical protein